MCMVIKGSKDKTFFADICVFYVDRKYLIVKVGLEFYKR